jgi:flagellar hook-basal body complex protein FliE
MTPIPPVDPSAIAPLGPEWQVPGVAEQTAPAGESFGQLLSHQLDNLSALQADAGAQSAALANGTATDPVAAVVAVEKAQLSMQFASTIRTRGAEALQDVFRTQI